MAEAVDGQQALEVFARERPDLVLLDVVMPRLTGLETCRILKAKAQGNYLR
ncbi:response regulator [Pseudenhygromyxa sp. WMMC2535]|nr:response regulator [Pseudenhygromyxa sp. WMMC2535]